jgi:thiosulfate/3-mercaptopyruvate sulfurtransferase
MRQRTPYRCIGIADAEAILRRDGVLVLDVRDPKSYARAHINGAQHLSVSNLSEVTSQTAKNIPILIYCYHGHASREYAQIFSDFGFSEVFSLDGGHEAWRGRPPAEGAPVDEKLRSWLAEHGFACDDVNAVISNGTTPLMKASHQGNIATVRMLLAAGAQIDARNADGNNALWLACVGNHLDAVEALVDAGIDIDNRNDNGATPLMYAASCGNPGIIDRLLALGADVAPETLDGFTALDLAATFECLALLRRASQARNVAEATGTRSQPTPSNS